MTQPLAGQRALVTAGASGIGRAIAKRFRSAGARLFVCDIDDTALASFQGEFPEAQAMRADVADPAQVDALFAAVGTAFGGLDILVNNAGIAGPTKRVEDIATSEWDRCIDINLNGMFYCTRRGVPLLKAAGGGSIVNLSSVAGRLGYPLRAPYAASKWAVVGLTKSLAMELGPDGIRVNCIQPGLVAGPRIDGVIQAKADAFGIDFDSMKQRLLATVSLRRMVTAEDVAEMALFVCSPAGASITGQALSVCGDHQVLQ
jgi:NAD(P)-dependent dehydrogenase (short-subunit alcohol dehydrogenase family)